MITDNLKNMVGGWFIGDFNPAVLRTKDFEAGIKYHPKGEKWPKHWHAEANEYNVLIKGFMTIQIGDDDDDENFHLLSPNDIFIIEKGEIAEPYFLTNCTVVTIKVPSVPGDKHVVH